MSNKGMHIAISFLIAGLMFFLLQFYVHAASPHTDESCLPLQLKEVLNEIRSVAQIEIISTKAPRKNRSFHPSCRAVDFKVIDRSRHHVMSLLRRIHRGGVGTYSGLMHHIHIDAGPPYRWHKKVVPFKTGREFNEAKEATNRRENGSPP